VATACLSKRSWDERCEGLRAFKEQHAHTQVPPNKEWASLLIGTERKKRKAKRQ